MSVFPIIKVSDVERAARFYEQAFGFERAYRWPAEGGEPEYVYLRRGESGIGLGRGAGGGDFELCVYVDNVDAAAEQLRALGAREVAAPADQPWGERMASFDDLDGNRLLITMSL